MEVNQPSHSFHHERNCSDSNQQARYKKESGQSIDYMHDLPESKQFNSKLDSSYSKLNLIEKREKYPINMPFYDEQSVILSSPIDSIDTSMIRISSYDNELELEKNERYCD